MYAEFVHENSEDPMTYLLYGMDNVKLDLIQAQLNLNQLNGKLSKEILKTLKGQPLDKEKLKSILGNNLFQITFLANLLEVSLDNLIAQNKKELTSEHKGN